MPLMRRRRAMKRKSQRPRRKVGARRTGGRKQQSQVFTETFKCNTTGASPTSTGVTTAGEIQIPMPANQIGGKFAVKMTDLPQYNSYADLYQMYKILKVQAIILPKWNSADPNVAAQNNSTGSGTIASQESSRFVYAINDDSNDLAPPTSELEVLEDNGAKIRSLASRPIKINFRPKVCGDFTDPTSNQLIPTQTKYRPWIGFGAKGTPADAPVHVGVDWVASVGATAGTGFLAAADVQFKVSFVCKDPR